MSQLCGAKTADVPMTPIQGEIKRLMTNIDELERVISTLNDRLQPVLNPSVPVRGIDTCKEEETKSKYAYTISGESQRIENLTISLRNTLDALEV